MTTTYNPKKVTCSLGNHIVSGFADDSMITVEFAGDGTSYVSGADGEVVRSIDPSEIYTVKLAVLQTSPTNAFLQNMFDKDKKDGNGTFNININDILGKEKFVAEVGWVTKPASFVRGKTQNNREWGIACKGQFK
ncbi:MAG: phage structural protein [Clostridium sp.]